MLLACRMLLCPWKKKKGRRKRGMIPKLFVLSPFCFFFFFLRLAAIRLLAGAHAYVIK